MSAHNEIDITCKECGEEFKGVVWTAVHAAQDPELKELLLGGEINLLVCPQCSHLAYQEHFILYQDPAAEVVAYIYPPSQRSDENFLHKVTMENYKEAQAVYRPQERKDYDPLLVFGLDQFVEMMRGEDVLAAQSQIAEVLCKENSIPYTILRPSEARRLHMMRVLPGVSDSGKPTRASVLAGLEKLLTMNPTLNLYSQFCAQIQDDPDWNIKQP